LGLALIPHNKQLPIREDARRISLLAARFLSLSLQKKKAHNIVDRSPIALSNRRAYADSRCTATPQTGFCSVWLGKKKKPGTTRNMQRICSRFEKKRADAFFARR
jgi:hypothetical protein